MRNPREALARRILKRAAAAAVVCLVAAAPPALHAQQAEPRFLAKEQIILYGIGLRAEPSRQVVPRDIATIVSTFLQAPTLPDGLPAFADAEVRATLRGPSFTGAQELVVQPNAPFNIPPLTVAGIHTLENIRLTSHGEVLLRAVPESVVIEVIEKLLVTQVSARALTAAEIREKGIVFDRSSFQAYNFSAAFAIDDQQVTINFPVVLPQIQPVQSAELSQVAVPQVDTPSLPSLKTIIPDTLRLQTQIPNLTVVGFTLKVPTLEGQDLFVPPIPGVIVIPGDIGFLNQFFSVNLMVGNVAPAGSNLVVSDLQAEIVLPIGSDLVAGSGDDPLRMARTASGETLRKKLVVQPGPDGQLGTTDDLFTLGPGETGNAEYLVEGMREGSHVVEMEMSGTLHGLPVGPVTVRGRAAGSVLVRNPAFSLTFTHPEVVNAGEPYTLDVTVTNTSASPANFVSLNLYPRNVSGATIVGSNTREIESIPPGDSATVTFDLISSITGKVTAATLDSTENVAGRFALKTSVGELGIPLSPDSLVLPKESSSLPKSLRDAAIGLLGKAWAVATAPAAALPKEIQRFSKQIVLDRAVEVAESGFRVSLHEPLADSAAHLAMDVMGNKYAWLPQTTAQPGDLVFAQNNFGGFDALRRQSVRGDRFADAVAAILTTELSAKGAQTFHADLASRWSYRPAHVSALVAGGGGPLPYRISIVDGQGRRVGGAAADGKVVKQIPYSDLLTFGLSGGTIGGEMAVLASPGPGVYTVRLDRVDGVADGAPYALSLVVPDATGGLRHLTFQAAAGQGVPTVAASSDPIRLRVEVYDGNTVASGSPVTPDIASVVDPPPTILGATQQLDADLIRCDKDSPGMPIGRVIAVLFSEELTAASVQDRLKPEELTKYRIEGNQVVGVALQPGRRIAFLALRDPYGPLVPRALTVSDVTDLRGQPMPAASVPIESTIGTDGGVVSGRVMRADGSAVPLANVRLFYLLNCDLEPRWIGISSKTTDVDGRYSWDFVSSRFTDRIVALDDTTNESRDLRFSVQRSGQRLNVDVVFVGRGTFKGRTLAEDGRILPQSAIRVTSLTDNSQYGVTTDAAGRFEIGRIPVGNLLVEAVNVDARAQFFFSENIPFAGAITARDITLLDVPKRDITIKTGRIHGFVYRPDGVTPIADVPVIAYYQNRSQSDVPCPKSGFPPKELPECAVAVIRSAPDGAFAFEKVTAGGLRLYAFDGASLSQGNAHVVLPADAARTLNVLLVGGLATVTGRVVDPAGAPVAGAHVGGGFTLVTTDAEGQFTLIDVPVGRRDIVAVSDSLGTSSTVTVDIVRAGETVGVTLVLESVASVAGLVVRADGTTPAANRQVYVFRQKQSDNGEPQVQIFGSATTDAAGAYRIDRLPMGSYGISVFEPDFRDGNIGKVVLKFHQQVFKADITYRGGGGIVRGAVFEDDGATPLKARLGLSGDQLVVAGGLVGVAFQYVQNYRIVDTDFTTGHYSFSGLWVGAFTLRAVGQFSPDPIAVEGNIPGPNQIVDLNLTLQSTSQVSGIVYTPDGVTAAGPNVVVSYKSEAFKVFCSEDGFGEQTCITIPQGIQAMNAVTDENGRFFFPVVNAGAFTLTAEDPATGQVARIAGTVKSGEAADLSVRLLGVADLTVRVFASDATTPIANAKVDVEQLAYPKQKKTLIAGPGGTVTFAGGDAFSEGELLVIATDQGNGFTGRASGRIVKDGQSVAVNVYLFNATGTVYGTVLQPGGLTPAPNADIVISNASGPLSFTVTDADGTYRVTGIPTGPFTVDTFDPVTARRAFASAVLPLANQEVPVNLVLAALGVVKGTLVQGGTLGALKSWEITLNQQSQSGRALPTLKTTTAVDGSWAFPGTSRGTFTLLARKPDVQGTTSASGTIDREGQIVDVPLVVNTLRPLAGRVDGTVFNPDGTRAANSIVEVCYAGRCSNGVPPLRLTTDPQGAYFVDDVPLGRFAITALSQTTRNVGRRFGDMELDGDVVIADVAMVGVTEIVGTVIRADGTPAVTAIVKLDGSPATGCEGPCTQGVKPADGTFGFVDVPARTFTITAQDPVTGLKGSAGGTLNPGEQKSVIVVLEPTGSVGGRVLRAAGQPAHGIVAELILSPGAPGERRLYLETGADGQFLFDSAPIASFTLNLQDPAGSGLAKRIGTVAGGGALGDILLDEAPPAVGSMVPAVAAVGVPQNQIVRVVFTEPILPGTVTAGSVVLEGPTGPVASLVNVVEGDTVATLTPLSPLKDETRYTVRVESVKDRVGKAMPSRFTSSFTTVDITAPAFVSVSPSANANGVPIYTPVRIQFSEPIDPAKFNGPPLTLSGPQGAVAGRLDYTFGNTVVVFTPNLPLDEASTYRATMTAAGDTAGNIQSQDLDYTFTTTDRTPPQILGLVPARNGTVIENTTTSVTATLGLSHDVALVDWYVNDVFTFAGRALPFVFSFKATPQVGAPGSQISVSAIATDTSGNRGTSAVSIPITVVADQVPAVAIVAPAGTVSARNGDRIDVRVTGSDDVGLTQIGYKANTGQPQDSATHRFDPAASPRTESFAFTIPPDAAPGSSIVVEASGVDTAGHLVMAAPLTVTVIDAVNPVVAITGTTSGAKVNPGQTTTAIVSAEDLGGLASITFTVGGAVASTQTREISPSQNAVAASFSIQVPANAQPGQTLTLDAAAIDRAGNRGTAARVILPVADTVPPTVRLSSATGSLELVKGQPFTVYVDAEDEIALARVEISGQGAFTMSDAKPVSPPLGSARVAFTINVPDTLAPGAILNLRATAVDISGNASAPALLTLSVKALVAVTLPISAIVIAGESIPVAVQLAEPAPAGGLRVDFSSTNANIAAVAPSLQFASGETTRPVLVTGVSGGSATIRAAVQGVQRASMTATVRGGVVRGVVYDSALRPVAGASLTINSTVTATTGASGDYFAEGVTGPSVTVKAVDPVSGQRGYATASMNRANGFATVNLILVPAGAVRGDIKTATNAPAGGGVKVELFASANLSSPLQLAFTGDGSQYEFPVVTPGSYVLVATSTNGHRGRATVVVGTSGNEETVPLVFVGEGSVVGTVFDGAGAAVPRAPLTFRSVSVFGAEPPTRVNAEADGTFRFDRVLVGSYTVEARDEVTGRGGATSGTIAQNAQVVTADVHLSTYGNISGVVRRPDGATVAVGALVKVGGHSTLTNDLGEYSFSFLPLAPFTITVNDQGTRQMGRATGTLTTQGETRTVDITLHPQGTLIVSVTDAIGNPVANAAVAVSASDAGLSDSLSATTGPDGTVVIARVLSGAIQVKATAGSLHGALAATLAADEVKPVTVALEATGSIAGVIYEPDGQTPAIGARVTTANRTATTGVDGAYRFDGLPLTTAYSIVVADSAGRTRAKTKTLLVLSPAPAVTTRNFTMVGLGTVTGRVLNPDSSSAPNLVVSVRSFNADFGGLRTATTNAGGFYTVANVPVGAVSVSTGDVTRLLLGEGSGTIAAHGGTATVDILLVSNAVTPPVLRYDANNYAADIQRDGTLTQGSSAFRVQGGLALDVVGGGVPARFEGTTIATIENGGREIAVRQQGLAGLNVTRKVAVPRNGYFARYLDILSNPTSEPVTVDVRVTSQLRHTLIWKTSSGDTALDVDALDSADRWIVVDDAADAETGIPATAFVFDGPGGAQRVGAATTSPASPLDMTFEWRSVTVPANGSVASLYFVAQQTSRAAAQASAERLVQLPPEALDGLSLDELAVIANFAVPADGASPLQALPPVLATVDGHVLASDGTTAIAGSVVRFRSASPLFGRSYQATTAQDGRFVFAGTLNDSGTSRAIAVEGFTLRADHPVLGTVLQSPSVAAAFADGLTTATQDVVFSNTGLLRGTVRFNGVPVGGASVVASGTFGSTAVNVTTQSAGNGGYLFPLLPTGAASVRATATQQGKTASATVGTVVTSGVTVDVDVPIDTLAPQLTIVTPAAGTEVDPRAPLEVTVTAVDPGGVVSFAFSSTGSVVRSETRAGTTADTRTETFLVPFDAPLPIGGSLTFTIMATDGAGNQATAALTVAIRDVVGPVITQVTPADAAVDVEPAASVVVAFSEPIDRASVDAASLRLTRGDTEIAVVFSFSDNDHAVTMTPAQPLALNSLHTVTAGTEISDAAGNQLPSPVSTTFTTKAPDATPPRVSSIAPASNAVDVPVGSFIQVAFTEAIDPATVNPASLRVSADGIALSGALTLLDANREVRFTPAQPLPFGTVIVTELTASIADPSGNALVDADGNALQVPLTFTFMTASFGITKPARGESVVENQTAVLEAQAGSSLGVATITFVVNGQALPAVAGPPFSTVFVVPPAATAPTLTIVAIGRNNAGTEVARDEVVVNVVTGLRMQPTLVGIPLGGSSSLRVGLSSPIATDLPIALTAGDASVVTLPAQPVVLPAGQLETTVQIGGAAAGNTTIIATSVRGNAAVVASVSPAVAKPVSIYNPIVGVRLVSLPLMGRVFAVPSGQTAVSLQLLGAPAATATTVSITSSNPSVARVDVPVTIAAGEQAAAATIVTGSAGTATLTLRAGDEVRQLSIVVGPPPASVFPSIVARPVGINLYPAFSIGRVLTAQAQHMIYTLPLLTTASGEPTTVTVSSSNAAVAAAPATITIPAGQRSAVVEVFTGAEGTATLTFNTAGDVRQLTVIVGRPTGANIPVTVAKPVGMHLLAGPIVGTLFAGRAAQSTIAAPILSAPAASDTILTVTTSDPNVASVTGPVVIPAGSQAATLTVASGTDGVATLTIEAAGQKRMLVVVVGTPPASRMPTIVAPIIGVEIKQ